MEVSSFFTRFLQTPKETVPVQQPDDLVDFDAAWQGIQETLEHPDERQLVKGITATEVPAQLRHIVDALVYEGNRGDEDTTGACLEYFLKNDLLGNLERLCEADRPHGIKAEVLRAINNLVVLLSERFLVHNAVHRPLRRLLRSCVGDEPEEKVDGGVRIMGAAGMESVRDRQMGNEDLEGDLVDLMCILCSRMRAYPPLLLIFFHDKGWLVPGSDTSSTEKDRSRAFSPTPSALTSFSNPSAQHSTKVTHHFEFLLFSYLLRFVHREGRTGDFARAGLLFLFDIAFLTATEEGGENLSTLDGKDGSDPLQDARDALGEFILDGDFADVMAAGLGAIFSLLPSKLRVPSLADQAKAQEGISASASGGMHLGATLQEDEKSNSDILPSSADPDIRSQLDLLLKLFGFMQDIIYRCNSPALHADPDSSNVAASQILGAAISDATLDAIQSSFLDNVLYPSILECSSTDGSSVAVLTYLDVIFSNLDDGPLLHRLVEYLMDTSGTARPLEKHAPRRKTGAMGFVRSQPTEPVTDYFAEEGKFTLKDLILDNLRSTSWSASTAALRLLETLLKDHCRQAVSGILTAVRDPRATALARRPIPQSAVDDVEDFLPSAVTSADVHLQEVELYGSLISRIDPLQSRADLTAGYTGYLADMQIALQGDRCYQTSHIPLQFDSENEKSIPIRIGRYDIDPFQHRMSPSDPVVRKILNLFGSFFCQTPDENVALTGVLTGLALCPHRSLAGWLLYDVNANGLDPWTVKPKLNEKDDDEESLDDSLDESRNVVDMDKDDPFTARASMDLPAIYQILRDLVKQIASFRNEVEDFDRLLSERRQGLLFADHLDEAMNIMLDVEPSIFGPLTPIPSVKFSTPPKRNRPNPLTSSIRSFLTPRKKSLSTQEINTRVLTPPKSISTNINDLDSGDSSPFKSHYEATTIPIETQTSTPISTGPWSPGKIPPTLPSIRAPSALSHNAIDSSSVFSGIVDVGNEEEDDKKRTTLTIVLDNCVILEEFLKEIVGLITARRALGIDQIGFM